MEDFFLENAKSYMEFYLNNFFRCDLFFMGFALVKYESFFLRYAKIAFCGFCIILFSAYFFGMDNIGVEDKPTIAPYVLNLFLFALLIVSVCCWH